MLVALVFVAKLLGLTGLFYALMSPWRRRLRTEGLVGPRPYLAVVGPAPLPPPPPQLPPPGPSDRIIPDLLGTVADDPRDVELVSAIAAAPADVEMRMVYGDYLEERGESAKANFVRGTNTATETIEVRYATSVEWRAITSAPRIICTSSLCPTRWTELAPIAGDRRRRRCPRCDMVMRYCANHAEGGASALDGELSTIDLADEPRPPRGFDV